MAKNPCCCGCTLQTGTKVIAIINIVFSSIACIVLFLGLVLGAGAAAIVANSEFKDEDGNSVFRDETGSPLSQEEHDERQKTAATVLLMGVIISAILLISCIGQLAVAILLLMGANQRHHGKCRIWYIVTLVFFVIFIIRSIFRMVVGGLAAGFGLVIIEFFSFAIGFAIVGYQLYVVYCFMEELKEGGDGTNNATAGYVHSQAGQPGYVYTQAGNAGPENPPYGQPPGYVAVPIDNQAPSGGFVYPNLNQEKGLNA